MTTAEFLRKPVTLLAAAIDHKSSTVLIAADSQLVRTDIRSEAASTHPVDKLFVLGDRLAFGYQGSVEIGEPFRQQVEARWESFAGWLPFAAWCCAELRKANSADLRKPTPALLAGFVGNKAGVVTLDATGNFRFADDAAFVGWGRVAAAVGWRLANRVIPDQDFTTRFRSMMEETVSGLEGLEPPISAWRITAGGIERPWPFDLPGQGFER